MLPHNLRLACKSLIHTPLMSTLVVIVLAVGIGTSVVAATLYHARGSNPIWWKDDRLYRPMIDSRPLGSALETDGHPEYPPKFMIYRDALAIYGSTIPTRALLMMSSSGIVEPSREDLYPTEHPVRLTTRQFFAMFDVPFLYGRGWSNADDDGPAQVVVISRHLNERLFGGKDSLGKTVVVNGQPFQVVGVLDRWLPTPQFYDPSQSFGPGDDVYLPFAWARLLPDLPIVGFCQQTQTSTSSFREIEGADCISTAVWTELDTEAQRRDFKEFLDNYSRAQLAAGRFERPVNSWLPNVSGWLRMNNVVGNQSRFQLLLALAFLAVCTLNALGLLLNKFFSTAHWSGIRRALGATRGDIVRMHLAEVLLLVSLAGGLGIGLAAVGLRMIRHAFFLNPVDLASNPEYGEVAVALSHMDLPMLLLAVGLSLGAGALAGIYPAWRIGRLLPAMFLKAM